MPTANTIALIGNPTRDRIVCGDRIVETPGGTVVYAGLLLARLGWEVAVVGKGDAKMQAWLEAAGIRVDWFIRASRVVEFENIYHGNRREQKARCGETILAREVPAAVYRCRAVLVGPVLQEVDFGILTRRTRGPVLLDAQGFLRRLTPDGRVEAHMGRSARAAIAGAHILKVDQQEALTITGEADVARSARRLRRMGPAIVLITRGEGGLWIQSASGGRELAAIPATPVDPTGAGDVLAAAFLSRHLEGASVEEAARFGMAAAGLAIEGFATEAIPTRPQIEARLRAALAGTVAAG